MFRLLSCHILTLTQHSQWQERCGGHTKVFVCKHFITTMKAYELKVRANLAFALLLQHHDVHGFLFTPCYSLYVAGH